MKLILASLLLSAGLLALVGPPPAHSCAVAMRPGDRVDIAAESALIVWDEKTKTQHFIRRASFQTQVPYFGFLVPTPTEPKLYETPDEAFQHLEDWTKRELKHEKAYVWLPSLFMLGAAKQAADTVEVVGKYRIAGGKAVVLKASDAEALRKWLDEHGYDARPQLRSWLDVYVRKGWFITAFQFARTDQKETTVAPKAVRMSFRTEQPFFPYREPAEEGANPSWRPRLLRVFFLAGQRMEGNLEDGRTAWPGKTAWANALPGEQHEALASLLDRKQVPVGEGAWLTVFDDDSSTRPAGGDVFFSPSADQSAVKRPPIIALETVYVPVCEVACGLVVATPIVALVLLWWRRRRRV